MPRARHGGRREARGRKARLCTHHIHGKLKVIPQVHLGRAIDKAENGGVDALGLHGRKLFEKAGDTLRGGGKGSATAVLSSESGAGGSARACACCPLSPVGSTRTVLLILPEVITSSSAWSCPMLPMVVSREALRPLWLPCSGEEEGKEPRAALGTGGPPRSKGPCDGSSDVHRRCGRLHHARLRRRRETGRRRGH